MSAIFLDRDRNEIVIDMLREFKCQELPQQAWVNRKEPKQRSRKRQLCIDTLAEFEKALEGPNRPRTKQDAINQIYPQGIGYLLMWMVFRAVVAQIVAWLYDRTQA
jgi:hypothetical protein